jgi:hypothetical protein
MGVMKRASRRAAKREMPMEAEDVIISSVQ